MSRKNKALNYAKRWNDTYKNKVMSYSEKEYWREFFEDLAAKCGLKKNKEFATLLISIY